MFKAVLGSNWDRLDPVLQARYNFVPGTTKILAGTMQVKHGRLARMLMPLIRITGALVPVQGSGFQVTVTTDVSGDELKWMRIFKKDNKTYDFKSSMREKGDKIIESVGMGIGLRMQLKAVQGGLEYIDKGYVISIGKYVIPLPFHWLLGRSHVVEKTSLLPDREIHLLFTIRHPLFGFVFSYEGDFNMKETWPLNTR